MFFLFEFAEKCDSQSANRCSRNDPARPLSSMNCSIPAAQNTGKPYDTSEKLPDATLEKDHEIAPANFFPPKIGFFLHL